MSEHTEENRVLTDSEAPQNALLSPGTIIGKRYEVISVLGSGGMGTVYQVKQIDLKKNFAMKLLDADRQTDIAVRRFHQEAKTAASLRHPNLVQVQDFGVFNDNQPYLVMDYVKGIPLDQLLKERRTLPVDYVVALAIQVGFGLMYAHQEGVVHRDIKPGNILVLQPNDLPTEGTVKVVDFGIAKLLQSEDGQIQQLTRTGEIFGSPVYMSPEQCRGAGVDQRSDIYSLGCVMYECLTGLPPIVGDTAMSTMVKRLTEKPPSLKDGSLGLDFPRSLEIIVQKMLATDPQDRYQDFGSVIQGLMRIDDSDAVLPSILSNKKKQYAYKNQCLLALGTAIVSCLVTFLVDKEIVVPKLVDSIKPKRKLVAEEMPASSFATKLPRPWREVGTGYGAQETLHFPARSGWIKIGGTGDRRAEGPLIIPKDAYISLRINEEAAADDHFLDNLKDVRFAEISFNSPMIGISNSSMEMFRDLKHLDHLRISETPISNLEPIYHAPELKNLDVSETHVPLSELLHIDRFKELSALSFGPVKDPSLTLKALKANQVLSYIRYNGPARRELKTNARGLEASDVEELIQLRNLSSMSLHNCPTFDDECLKRLLSARKIVELHLTDCGVTAKSIPLLQKQKLWDLKISTNGWSKADTALLKSLPYKVEIAQQEHAKEREKLNGAVSASARLFFDAIDATTSSSKRKDTNFGLGDQ